MTNTVKQKTKVDTQINNKLSSSLKLGVIHLNVKDITEMTNFYHSVMGLDILQKDSEHVTLGKNNNPLIILRHRNDLSHGSSESAGLYHFAIVFASRGDLARMIYRILKQKPHHFSGSADHLVSEAFYFTDPEGNGIELYYDRDRSDWEWENNQVKMATMYIDPVAYLQKHTDSEDKNKEVVMGHFHLKVGDIDTARRFYVDILGFDITAELPGALFISVGGYHHHFGLNVWESTGSSEREPSLGLERLDLILPTKEDLNSLKNRLKENSIPFKEQSDSLMINDAWKNTIMVRIE